MRKKDLLQQNSRLFDELQKTRFELNDLKKQLNSRENEIEFLKTELKNRENKSEEPTEPMHRLEEKVIATANSNPDFDYGAKIIGEIVVCAAEYSNKLTLGGDDRHKELVNLILGKTEIAKAEILSVVESNDTFEVKCTKIDNIATVSKEYFESVAAQIV